MYCGWAFDEIVGLVSIRPDEVDSIRSGCKLGTQPLDTLECDVESEVIGVAGSV
jgi:hypothetical protein